MPCALILSGDGEIIQIDKQMKEASAEDASDFYCPVTRKQRILNLKEAVIQQ